MCMYTKANRFLSVPLLHILPPTHTQRTRKRYERTKENTWTCFKCSSQIREKEREEEEKKKQINIHQMNRMHHDEWFSKKICSGSGGGSLRAAASAIPLLLLIFLFSFIYQMYFGIVDPVSHSYVYVRFSFVLGSCSHGLNRVYVSESVCVK